MEIIHNYNEYLCLLIHFKKKPKFRLTFITINIGKHIESGFFPCVDLLFKSICQF